MVKPVWMSLIPVNKKRRLQSVTNQELNSLGTILLHARMTETYVPDMFVIVNNLAILVPLRTSFVDKFVKGFFPAEKKIVRYDSQSVTTLMVHEESNGNRKTTKNNRFN